MACVVAKDLCQNLVVFVQKFEAEAISDYIGYDLKADGHKFSFCEA